MSKFVVSATIDDPSLKADATFEYRVTDNRNYIIDKYGGVEAKPGYTPQIGDKYTVETLYRSNEGYIYKSYKTFKYNINTDSGVGVNPVPLNFIYVYYDTTTNI